MRWITSHDQREDSRRRRKNGNSILGLKFLLHQQITPKYLGAQSPPVPADKRTLFRGLNGIFGGVTRGWEGMSWNKMIESLQAFSQLTAANYRPVSRKYYQDIVESRGNREPPTSRIVDRSSSQDCSGRLLPGGTLLSETALPLDRAPLIA